MYAECGITILHLQFRNTMVNEHLKLVRHILQQFVISFDKILAMKSKIEAFLIHLYSLF